MNNIKVIILVLLVVFATLYNTYSLYFNEEHTSEDILALLYEQKNRKLLKELKTVKNEKPYKALAFTVDDKGYLVCWYVHDAQNQKFADTVALKNCNKASKNLEVNKECKLYNDIFSRI